MKSSKPLLGGLAATASLGFVVSTAAPAMADEASVGPHSCQYTVKLVTNSTKDTFMRLNSGGQYRSATKSGGNEQSEKTLHSPFGATTSGGASTGGVIYSLRNGCDY